ncbi:cupin domain-containing protein [Sphingomonas quercus]|uniref:Cupin domain-containing protein n=1 Tax=Sphingomonas quercus TaxID=2842451 RepID=A0ABS6BIS5_9SPHN|nr:cupin domain-containing protein [Sphingomonas quercus]MBU3078079.1 cupin domain-containing protein [Sphingomonas quercus]
MRIPSLALLPLAAAAALVAPAAAQRAPLQAGAPAVTAAPGRGVIASVSGHSAAEPLLYRLDVQPVEQVSPLVQRQYLSGGQSTFVQWTVKASGVFPLHHHANEQITWITKGRCEVFSQEKKFVLTAGSVLIIPPNVPHEFRCTEDSIDIDFFAPGRQDWADGTPSVAARP